MKEGWISDKSDTILCKFYLPLPAVLTTKDALIKIREIIQQAKSIDEYNLEERTLIDSIRQFDDTFRKMRGKTANDATIEVIDLITQKQNPEKYDLENNSLLSMTPDFLFEAIKNTYDSVMIRNYLSCLSREELKEKEPLVYEAMNQQGIKNIEAIDSIELVVNYFTENEESKIILTDNGAGKAIIDAFKIQHSNNHRARLEKEGETILQDANIKYDSIYDVQGPFSMIGMKAGGLGKGKQLQSRRLVEIDATQYFEEPDNQLGVRNILSWSPRLTISPTPSTDIDIPLRQGSCRL